MSEPNDKLLHDWVRQTLEPYRPDYDPADWERLRPRLHRRPHRRWLIGLLVIFLLGGLTIGGWWFTARSTTEPITKNNRSAKTVTPSLPHRVADLKRLRSRQSVRGNRPRPAGSAPTRNPFSNPTVKPFLELVITAEPIRFHSIAPTIGPLSAPTLGPVRIPSAPEMLIQQQMLSGFFGSDSTSYRALDRNSPRWPNAVIVCDFTTSMYPYSTQLFAWLKKNNHNPTIRGTVFFTDCDSLGQETRPGGPPGRMFVATERDPARALPVLLEASRNTVRNENEAENDVEALLFAQKTFPDAEHLILLADIDNPVKDLSRLAQLQKPVHIVLCGRDWDSTQAFHPDYFTIARQTNGSLHTLEDDIDPTRLTPNTWLRVGQRYYRYHRGRGQFVLTRFRRRPERF